MLSKIGTIWGIIAFIGLIFGAIQPHLERKSNLKRFKNYDRL